MKINRRQLRELLLQEAKIAMNESKTVVDDLEAFYASIRKAAPEGAMALSPVGMVTTYMNHKDVIDAAYESGGTEEASRKFLEIHQQLARDVGRPVLQTLDAFVKSATGTE